MLICLSSRCLVSSSTLVIGVTSTNPSSRPLLSPWSWACSLVLTTTGTSLQWLGYRQSVFRGVGTVAVPAVVRAPRRSVSNPTKTCTMVLISAFTSDTQLSWMLHLRHSCMAMVFHCSSLLLLSPSFPTMSRRFTYCSTTTRNHQSLTSPSPT